MSLVQCGIFTLYDPFWKVTIVTYIQLPSSTADEATKKLTKSKSFARILMVVTLIFIFSKHYFHWIFAAKSLLIHGLHSWHFCFEKPRLHTEATLKHKLKEGNGDSRRGLPLRRGALFASTQVDCRHPSANSANQAQTATAPSANIMS